MIIENGDQNNSLTEGQRLLTSILESMPDGFVVLNRDWVYTYVNEQAERLLQVSRTDILSRNIWDCFPRLLGTTLSERLREAMEHGVITEIEEFYPPLNVWLDVRAAPIPDGLTIYFRDVTQRRVHEEALQASHQAVREAEARFRALTEYSSDLVTILAPNGTILYDSPSVAAILGLEPSDRLGKNISIFLHPDELPDLRSLWRNHRRDDLRSTRATHRLLHADGSWRWMESVGSLQMDNPGIRGIVLNTRDIGERKRMEEQFVQAAKLAALGELVAGVAHEINNPLSAISGHAQLLMLHPDDMVRQDGTVIQDMVQRMSRIIRSLRSFAKSAGDRDALQKPSDLNGVVHSALEVIGSRLRSHDVEIGLTLADNIPPIVINQGEIEQVIVNLLVNADQALRDVEASTRRVHITTSLQTLNECRDGRPPCCRLTVSDSGPGIPPEILPRIFEPFFTTKDVGEGTGLGLSISHSIVVSHGGALIARNRRSGIGATFTIELPVEAIAHK